MKKYIKLFEEFNHTTRHSLIEWAVEQATRYAESFLDVVGDAEEGEDENESQHYDKIMSIINKFDQSPQSLSGEEYANMLFWIANANYEELGEGEIMWKDSYDYNQFLMEVSGLQDDIENDNFINEE